MTPTEHRAEVPHVGPTLVRNLPVALLACAGVVAALLYWMLGG